ncbi:MAG: cyclopropane-fatty-acyl-phospholipid synthase family protein [Pseudomonadota bacterium]
MTEMRATAAVDIQPRFSLARRVVLKLLGEIRVGRLTLIDGPQQQVFGGSQDGPSATIVVNRDVAYTRVLRSGVTGAGEAFFEGDWDTPDLTAVVRLFVLNRKTMQTMNGGLARAGRVLHRLWHWARRNSVAGSKRNISAHYDISNAFFETILDESMMYSSALFHSDSDSLAQAQQNKLARLCELLDLQPGDHVLEIGTGWGGLAEYAATHHDVVVTTTTISRAQFNYAKARIARSGLEGRVHLLDSDYRALTGRYDKIVSVEMIEAVGEEHLPTFFKTCNDLLRPGGRLVLQAITIPDAYYDDYRRSTDFIQRYVFPGGFLPSLGAMERIMHRDTALQIATVDDIGLHYAKTLRVWHDKLIAARSAVSSFGFDERLYRLWRYYFSYCEGGFAEQAISTVHLVANKSDGGGAVDGAT